MAVAERFLEDLEATCPAIELDFLDLWEVALPDMDGDTIAAKYARLSGQPFSPGQLAAWNGIEEIVDRFDRADRLVISTPLWNFGIPYRLKHLIDVITQPGLSFSFAPDVGYRPLLRDRPAVVILASAGDYRDGTSRWRPDLATPYLREALAFIGIRDVRFIAVGPTAGPNDIVAEAEDRAEKELANIHDRWAQSLRVVAG